MYLLIKKGENMIIEKEKIKEIEIPENKDLFDEIKKINKNATIGYGVMGLNEAPVMVFKQKTNDLQITAILSNRNYIYASSVAI